MKEDKKRHFNFTEPGYYLMRGGEIAHNIHRVDAYLVGEAFDRPVTWDLDGSYCDHETDYDLVGGAMARASDDTADGEGGTSLLNALAPALVALARLIEGMEIVIEGCEEMHGLAKTTYSHLSAIQIIAKEAENE